VLALDTTAAVCSVSLLIREGGTVRQNHRSEPLTPGQSRSVLEMVDAVLGLSDGIGAASNQDDESGRPIELIGFGAGPGAFTGLRVACGVAQGLALGWSCPVVPVDSLSTLAWQAAYANSRLKPGPREGAGGARPASSPIVVALDVRMNEVAYAVFDPPPADPLPSASDTRWLDDLAWPQAVFGPVLCSPEQAADWIGERERVSGSLRFAGDAFRVYPALAEHQAEVGAEQPDAWAVAELALIGGLSDRAIDPAEAVPFYLRDKVALDRDEQERLRAARRAAEP